MMSEHQPVTDGSKITRRIEAWSQDADWSREELQSELRDAGVDPEPFVDRVLTHIRRFLPDTASGKVLQSPAAMPRPLLVALREETHLLPSAIAAAMEVPVTFLSAVSRHPNVVPLAWRRELAARAKRALQIEPDTVMASFETPFQYERAAFRDTAYTQDAVQHYTDLLAQSELTPEARQFWQDLATDPRA